jgi:hypothetical protein
MGGAIFQCTANVHFAFNEFVTGETSCEKKRQGGEKGNAKLHIRYNVHLYLITYHFVNRQREWPSQNNGIISAKKKNAPMKEKKRDHMAKQDFMKECISDALQKHEGGNCMRSFTSLAKATGDWCNKNTIMNWLESQPDYQILYVYKAYTSRLNGTKLRETN